MAKYQYATAMPIRTTMLIMVFSRQLAAFFRAKKPMTMSSRIIT